jgi:hypothetical protein
LVENVMSLRRVDLEMVGRLGLGKDGEWAKPRDGAAGGWGWEQNVVLEAITARLRKV